MGCFDRSIPILDHQFTNSSCRNKIKRSKIIPILKKMKIPKKILNLSRQAIFKSKQVWKILSHRQVVFYLSRQVGQNPRQVVQTGFLDYLELRLLPCLIIDLSKWLLSMLLVFYLVKVLHVCKIWSYLLCNSVIAII